VIQEDDLNEPTYMTLAPDGEHVIVSNHGAQTVRNRLFT
jgi:hypothetical protein